MGPIIAVLPFRFAAWRRNEKVLNAEKASLDEKLMQLPWYSFRADALAWIVAGVIMVIIYYGFFLPYASTSIKVMAACTAIGVFSGMLSYLKTEKRLIRMLASHKQAALMPKRTLTLSRKIFLLIVMMLGMMAITVLLMVLLDVYYLLDQDFSRSDVYWGIFKEIFFALAVLLTLSIIIIKRYAANLKQVMGLQLDAMEEISQGNLDRQVPVLSSDEFARFAQKTNEMMIGLQERDYCRTSFEKYVSPEVSHKILKDDISASGEMIDVTVLFCDLRDYTSFAESRNPQDVVGFMNQYFAAMEPIIRKHGGVVIQFIGDEIEAAFGAPKPLENHPDKAVQA
ncbi:MAG: adenylate/guanylate cyclase domain-containing protein, partial [Desulfobacterales bacterium]|nr:adenylate/guanylate cyclase domain-containing protein [Desulfobacterales bacterium]